MLFSTNSSFSSFFSISLSDDLTVYSSSSKCLCELFNAFFNSSLAAPSFYFLIIVLSWSICSYLSLSVYLSFLRLSCNFTIFFYSWSLWIKLSLISSFISRFVSFAGGLFFLFFYCSAREPDSVVLG